MRSNLASRKANPIHFSPTSVARAARDSGVRNQRARDQGLRHRDGTAIHRQQVASSTGSADSLPLSVAPGML